ncbi:peptide/nickel transport system permease protein [Tindallia magadiensis]|uniref:Peptide/nickel transport system permease protein n=1 Tax=Tindallia magadiensis TaxID=69895 RepID=A0A1I3GUB0_9FIRM|nr:ABC transporter permease [Tindallia magadiensis]SFI26951.1 peptide/nickel transport system permease protein [Tindallia magadiensis]
MKKNTFGKWINRLGILFLLLLILMSLTAEWIAPYDPVQVDMSNRLQPPSTEHLMGTDAMGRDILSRIIYGGRTSMILATAASSGTMIIGLFVGILGGYFGKWLDEIIQIFVKIFQSLPPLSFMLAIAGVLGPGFQSILIASLIVSWADFSRVVRAEILKIREESFIQGLRVLGAGHGYIIFRHILPSIIGPFMVLFTAQVGRTIIAIASLSYLGLGLQPPQPDWGVMIFDAKTYMRTDPHLMYFPGIFIIGFCFSVNLLGDALRDFFDTSERKDQPFL